MTNDTMAAVSTRAKRTQKSLAKRAMAAATKEPRLCDCGCGGQTAGGQFRPGHDTRLKAQLLKEFDAGDSKAGEQLVQRGWYSREALTLRAGKGLDTKERRKARIEAQIARLDEQIRGLQARRQELEVSRG